MRGNLSGLRSGLFIITTALAISQPHMAVAAPAPTTPYIKAVYSLPLTLDPIKMNDTSSLVVGNLIYDGLLRFSPTLTIEGALAENWVTSPDGKTLTFTLRKNARFHNGELITADDVVASLARAIAPASTVRKLYDCIEGSERPEDLTKFGVKALDLRTIVIRLRHPFPPILSILAGATAKVLPKQLIGNPSFFDHPIGSGPFMFASRTDSPRQVELARFEDYYRGSPQLQRMVLKELPEAEAKRLAAAGEIDDLANWPLTATDPVFKSGELFSSPVAATWIIGLNSRKKPFTSSDVRRLFRQDVDAESFRRAFYPDAYPAFGYIPPGLPGTRATHLEHTRAQVKRPQEKIVLVIPSELANSESMRAFLQNTLKAKGWNIVVTTMAWEQLMKGYGEKALQAFLVSMNMDYPDPEFLLRNFESKNSDNFSGLRNAELDRLLARARTSRDRKEREHMYRQALDILDAEAATVNLFHPRANYWVSNCVEGFKPNMLSDVYIDYVAISLKSGCRRKVAGR